MDRCIADPEFWLCFDYKFYTQRGKEHEEKKDVLHHRGNLDFFGFSLIFCLNVVLYGIAFYLMVKWSGNFWICCGFHTGWNYTQQYLFGLPNSGMTSGFGLFRGENAVKSFVFDPVYGNEGSLLTLVVSIIMIAVLLLLIKMKAAKGTNPLTKKMIET